MELQKAIEGYYIFFVADGKSPETLRGYRWLLSILVTVTGNKDLAEVTARDLQRFMVYLSSEYRPRNHRERISNATLLKAWVALRSFFGWAAQEFSLPSRPDLTLKRPRAAEPVIVPFTEADVREILKAAGRTRQANTSGRKSYVYRRPTAERDTALIMVLLDTGLRVSECLRLRVQDVDLTSGQVIVKAVGSGTKSKGRVVYLGKTSRRHLWHYLAGREDVRKDDYLFVANGGRAMNRTGVLHLFNRLGERAGVRCHPHRLRHTFAIEFLRNGGNVFELQAILGHSDLGMVRHYAQLAQVDVAAAHRRASPVDRWRL